MYGNRTRVVEVSTSIWRPQAEPLPLKFHVSTVVLFSLEDEDNVLLDTYRGTPEKQIQPILLGYVPPFRDSMLLSLLRTV